MHAREHTEITMCLYFIFLPSLLYVIRPSNRTWQKAGYDVQATKATNMSSAGATPNPISSNTASYKL